MTSPIPPHQVEFLDRLEDALDEGLDAVDQLLANYVAIYPGESRWALDMIRDAQEAREGVAGEIPACHIAALVP